MVIVIRMKSGFELLVTCETCELKVDPLTGTLTAYEIKGITDNKPIYLNKPEVECIWREMDGKRE